MSWGLFSFAKECTEKWQHIVQLYFAAALLLVVWKGVRDEEDAKGRTCVA